MSISFLFFGGKNNDFSYKSFLIIYVNSIAVKAAAVFSVDKLAGFRGICLAFVENFGRLAVNGFEAV